MLTGFRRVCCRSISRRTTAFPAGVPSAPSAFRPRRSPTQSGHCNITRVGNRIASVTSHRVPASALLYRGIGETCCARKFFPRNLSLFLYLERRVGPMREGRVEVFCLIRRIRVEHARGDSCRPSGSPECEKTTPVVARFLCHRPSDRIRRAPGGHTRDSFCRRIAEYLEAIEYSFQ